MDMEHTGSLLNQNHFEFYALTILCLMKGIQTQLIALTEISNEKLQNFKEIDAFIQVACPRLGTDNYFSKPVLSVPQSQAFIKLLKKEPIEEFFKIQHWL